MSKIHFTFFTMLCTAALLLSIFWMCFPHILAPASPSVKNEVIGANIYLLEDLGGKLLVTQIIDEQKIEPSQVYDIYVNLLPEVDAMRIKNGWYIEGDITLARLLEDLGG